MDTRAWAKLEELVTQLERKSFNEGYERAASLLSKTGRNESARFLEEQRDGRFV